MLRDRLVGIRDKSLSEKLQLDTELTLEKAKTTICQKEAVKEQSQQLTSQRPHLVEDVTSRASRRPHRSRGGANAQPPGMQSVLNAKRVVTSRPAVSAVASGGQANDAALLGTLTTQSSSMWCGTIQLNGKGVQSIPELKSQLCLRRRTEESMGSNCRGQPRHCVAQPTNR